MDETKQSFDGEKLEDEIEEFEDFKQDQILLHEENALEAVRSKLSGRVRYSCIDCSNDWLILGVNTGSLYFFERQSSKHKLIPVPEVRETICHLKVHSTGNLLAFSTSKSVYVFDISKYLTNQKKMGKITHNEEITYLQWETHSPVLFFSDNSGQVFKVVCKKLNQTLHRELLFKCDSSIVELDFKNNKLLVSSLTRCTIISFSNSNFTAVSVGTQKRDGRYGAAFHSQNLVLSARPKLRLWLVDASTHAVTKTLKFESEIFMDSPTISLEENFDNIDTSNYLFSQFIHLIGNLFLAWETNAMFLLDVNEDNPTIREWIHVKEIRDVCVWENSIIILHGNSLSKLKWSIPSEEMNQQELKTNTSSNFSLPSSVGTDLSDENSKSSNNGTYSNSTESSKSQNTGTKSIGIESSLTLNESSKPPMNGTNSVKIESHSPPNELSKPPNNGTNSIGMESPFPLNESSKSQINGTNSIEHEVYPKAPTINVPKKSKTLHKAKKKIVPIDPPPNENSVQKPGKNNKFIYHSLNKHLERIKKKKVEKSAQKSSSSESLTFSPALSSSGESRSASTSHPSSQKQTLLKSPSTESLLTSLSLPKSSTSSLKSSSSGETISSPSFTQASSASSTNSKRRVVNIETDSVEIIDVPVPEGNLEKPHKPFLDKSLQFFKPDKFIEEGQKTFHKMQEKKKHISTAMKEELKSFKDQVTTTATQIKAPTIKTMKPLTTFKSTLSEVITLFPTNDSSKGPKNPNLNPSASSFNQDSTNALSLEGISESIVEVKEELTLLQKTKQVLDSVLMFTNSKDRTVQSILQIIDDWIFLVESSVETNPEQENDYTSLRKKYYELSLSWVTEIFTSYLEIRLLRFSKKHRWTEDFLIDSFFEKYYLFLNLPRVFFVINQLRMDRCIEYLHSKEDELLSSGELDPERIGLRKQIMELISQKKGNELLDIIKKKNDFSFTLRFLPDLFQLVSEPTVQYCVSQYPNITYWNVQRCLYETNLHLYIIYLTKLTATQPECCSNQDIVETLFSCYLEEEKNPELTFFKNKASLLNIIDNRKVFHYNIHHLIELCETFHFSEGLARLYVYSHQIQKSIDIYLERDNLVGLIEALKTSHNIEDWHYLLEQLVPLMSTHESKFISVQPIVMLMIENLGTSVTIELLNHYPVLTNYFSPSLFETLLCTSQQELQQEKLIHQILENLDNYLWSQKPSAISPQGRLILKKEMDKSLDSLPFLQHKPETKSFQFKFDYTTHLPRFYEELSGHWGTSISFSKEKCPCCSLPVQENIGNISSVVIFPCGHSFHDFCIAEFDACVICYSQNITSLVLNEK